MTNVSSYSIMRVAVGSKNPLKLQAVESLLKSIYSKAEFSAIAVDSGVSSNPLSHAETIAGARKRARAARRLSGADWGIGLEGGMVKISDRWFSCVWCVIWDGEEESLGGGVHFELPESVSRAILQEAKEMGTCMDELSGLTMTKRKLGAEGVLTRGLIDRKTTFQNAISYALAPRLSPEYYKPGVKL